MSLLFTSIIVSIVLVILIFGCIYGYNKNSKRRLPKKMYYCSLLGLFGFGIILTGMFTKVEANQVGIVYDELNGGIQDQTYGEGLHVKSIFESITQISTANRSAALTTTGQTNDGQYATFEISVIYKIKKEDAGRFYRITNQTDIPNAALNQPISVKLTIA